MSLFITKTPSSTKDIPKKSFFDYNTTKHLIKTTSNLTTYHIFVKDEYTNIKKRVGYAFVHKTKRTKILEIFEIFKKYRNHGYGTWFLRQLRYEFEFHFEPTPNTMHYYLSCGAVPLIADHTTKRMIFAFLKESKPSAYYANIREPTDGVLSSCPDNFVYDAGEWNL